MDTIRIRQEESKSDQVVHAPRGPTLGSGSVLEVLEGSISVGRFHDRRKGRRRVRGGEVDLRKAPVVFWDADIEMGHRKSPRTGVSVDDHQARIELERWPPGWGFESALSMGATEVYDSGPVRLTLLPPIPLLHASLPS